MLVLVSKIFPHENKINSIHLINFHLVSMNSIIIIYFPNAIQCLIIHWSTNTTLNSSYLCIWNEIWLAESSMNSYIIDYSLSTSFRTAFIYSLIFVTSWNIAKQIYMDCLTLKSKRKQIICTAVLHNQWFCESPK
jgi:hypothetical protein